MRRYRIDVPNGELVPPLHDTEDDTGDPKDELHQLSIGDQVDVDGEIEGKDRVKVTVVEPKPRRMGWFAAAALKLDTNIVPEGFYNDLRLSAVGKTDHRYLFALAVAVSDLKNDISPTSGSDGFGPFQYTSVRWHELVDWLAQIPTQS